MHKIGERKREKERSKGNWVRGCLDVVNSYRGEVEVKGEGEGCMCVVGVGKVQSKVFIFGEKERREMFVGCILE